MARHDVLKNVNIDNVAVNMTFCMELNVIMSLLSTNGEDVIERCKRYECNCKEQTHFRHGCQDIL